ncbi:conserved Plasmodium protein, unknown function [Babesia microti strain RI]|uniref:Uncharacterized protein n=1 Tax=Babesia microti (strain RI) TaxID=1133968 RepID=A0A1N6LWT5_BABMR|nr:conserved Plasmodium protein, unknown function [Babesia microti strain RI]SIO73340.1 conserved Plasmodium protein, unknown function [Babesia microti strain RI]|eukprot:XP_021337442.1 conserved Plasmodium protein, unknown function [Babesia microti strain RI]
MVRHVAPQSQPKIKIAIYSFSLVIPVIFQQTICIRTPNYLVLDLIKIYGRLSQKSKIGHIIPLKNNDKLVSKLISPEKFYWELVFDKDDEELNFDQFTKRVGMKRFEWPVMINKNRRDNKQPFFIPVCQERQNRLMKQLDKSSDKEGLVNNKLLHLNAMVSNQEINKEALIDVFETFASSGILTKKSFSDKIKSYSPLLTLWDWDSFIRNMNRYHIDP